MQQIQVERMRDNQTPIETRMSKGKTSSCNFFVPKDNCCNT